MKLSKKIEKLRKGLNLSYHELSRRSGISEPQIYLLCRGKSSNPLLSTLLKLCRALKISVSELLSSVIECQQKREKR